MSDIADEGKRIMTTVASLLGTANEEVLLTANQSRIMPGGIPYYSR